MRDVTLTVYKFDELAENVKNIVLSRHRNINVEDYNWWSYDGILDVHQSDWCKNFGLKDVLFTYDLKRIWFDIEVEWYLQFNQLRVSDNNVFRQVLGIPEDLWEKVSYKFINNDEVNTEIEFLAEGDLTSDENSILINAIAVFDGLMSQALNELKADYDAHISDQAIIDTFNENKWEFFKNGKRFCEAELSIIDDDDD